MKGTNYHRFYCIVFKLYSELSSFQRFLVHIILCMWHSGLSKVSCSWKCPKLKGVLIEFLLLSYVHMTASSHPL